MTDVTDVDSFRQHCPASVLQFRGRMLTKSQYGIIVALVGVALAYWQWRDRRSLQTSQRRDPGEVIFRNTPHTSES
jgi:hypothetical protein